jgi:hypothetical protein
VLICCERKVLLAGCWFVLREKYCWLVADKPNEQGMGSGDPSELMQLRRSQQIDFLCSIMDDSEKYMTLSME